MVISEDKDACYPCMFEGIRKEVTADADIIAALTLLWHQGLDFCPLG